MTLPYVLIDLAAIAENYRTLQRKAPNARLAGVVKSNAYGLGMLPVAKALRDAGCALFITAYFEEALALREQDAASTIVPLHGCDEKDFGEAVARNITPMLNHPAAIEAWSAFARAKAARLPAMIHLDTGMNRLGLTRTEQANLAANHGVLDPIDIKAWSSHFARADEFDNTTTPQQRTRFLQALATLPLAPRSLANSSGIFWGEDYAMEIARPGIALYGGNPTPHQANPMQNVIDLRAPVLQVHDAKPKETVGYGASYEVTRDSRIAVLSLGYADGYHRALQNKGTVRIGDYDAPVLGRISMDLVTVDVTDIPESVAHRGAEASVIGPHRPIDQAAQEAGTICYELLTSLGPRIQRRYTT